MKTIVFFLEGRSEKEFLQILIPRLLNNYKEVNTKYVTFQGKKDLESKLYHRLKGWLTPDSTFVVLVDQDEENCQELKKRLHYKCRDIGQSNLIIRIACRELESWYFGDLAAVEKALDKKNLTSYSNKGKYREPDSIQKPSKELCKITNETYQKISGSRDIAQFLSLNKNTSVSFQTFIKGIKKLCGACDLPLKS